MVHNIDGKIECKIAGVRNAIMSLFINIDRQLLWLQEYSLSESGDFVSFHMCFNNEADRDSTLASLHGLQGLLNQCEAGSYYRQVLSDHDIPDDAEVGRTGSLVVDEWSK